VRAQVPPFQIKVCQSIFITQERWPAHRLRLSSDKKRKFKATGKQIVMVRKKSGKIPSFSRYTVPLTGTEQL
jgi:hypothetical protein